ncbi:hypothetical protein D3C75_1090030 [compost metagenome]
MYQGFFSTIMASINALLGVYPQFARGFESIYSISEVLTSTQILQADRRLHSGGRPAAG